MRALALAPGIAGGRGVDLEFVDALHRTGFVADDLTPGNQEDAEASQAFDVEGEGVVVGKIPGIEGGLRAVLSLAFGNEAYGELDRVACLAGEGGFVRAGDTAGDMACGDLAGTEEHLKTGPMGSDAGDGDAFAGFEDEDEMERGGGNDGGEAVEHDGGSLGGTGLAAGLVDAAIRDMGRRAEAAESPELGGGDDALEGLADGIEVERVAHGLRENTQWRLRGSRGLSPIELSGARRPAV